MKEITIKNKVFKIEATTYTLVIYQKLTGRSLMADFGKMETATKKMKGTEDVDFSEFNFMMFLDLLFCLQQPGNSQFSYEGFLKSLPLEFAFSKDLFSEMGKVIMENFSIKPSSEVESNGNEEKNSQGMI